MIINETSRRVQLDDVAVQSEYFNSVAYRDPMHPVVGAYADPKVRFIQQYVPMSGRILDVGCGNGIFTLRFAQAGAKVTGLDFSQFLLGQNAHSRLISGDATCLPFPDESFEVTFEANVLHHVPERERVIREMARTSRRFVVLLEPNRNNPLMFAFSMVVRAERGGLKSSMTRLEEEVQRCGLRTVAKLTTGMISQNNTPALLVPILKKFDRSIWWGEYLVLVAEKTR
jgi:ubiquinone/menaquinone biosynthesis C-methylase UbiE